MRRFLRGLVARVRVAGSNRPLDGFLTAFQPKDRVVVVRR